MKSVHEHHASIYDRCQKRAKSAQDFHDCYNEELIKSKEFVASKIAEEEAAKTEESAAKVAIEKSIQSLLDIFIKENDDIAKCAEAKDKASRKSCTHDAMVLRRQFD